MGKVVVTSCSCRAVVAFLWLLAVTAVVGVYRLGYVRGKITGMEKLKCEVEVEEKKLSTGENNIRVKEKRNEKETFPPYTP